MEKDSIKEELHFIFSNVNEWLKFAEAKNAVFVGIIGASLVGIIASWSALNREAECVVKYLFFPIEIIALTISFFSFLPYLKIFKKIHKEKCDEMKSKEINIYYFGHLRTLSKNRFLKELYNRLNITEPKEFSKLEQELTLQIITNAVITWRKYLAFKIAGYMSLLGFLISMIAILILSY